MKSGFYTITGNNQLSGWTEKKFQSTSESQTCTRKRSWSLFGGLLLIWSTTAFWTLAKPLHLRIMLSKSMRCTKYYTCSQYWSTEKGQFFSMTMLDWMWHNQPFKSWTNRAMKFFLIQHIHLTSQQLTTTYFFMHVKTFCRENASTTSRMQKILSKSSLNLKAWIFMLQ